MLKLMDKKILPFFTLKYFLYLVLYALSIKRNTIFFYLEDYLDYFVNSQMILSFNLSLLIDSPEELQSIFSTKDY